MNSLKNDSFLHLTSVIVIHISAVYKFSIIVLLDALDSGASGRCWQGTSQHAMNVCSAKGSNTPHIFTSVLDGSVWFLL